MFKGMKTQIKVHTFQQQIGGNQRKMVALIDHRTIVADTFNGFGMFIFKVLRQVLDESKLSHCGNFCAI